MNLVPLLEGDLRKLSVESRGRFPELKDAADRALVALRGVGGAGADAATVSARLAASDDVVRPLLLSLGAGARGAPELAAVGLSLLQKLFACRGVRGERLPEIVDALWDRFRGAEEEGNESTGSNGNNGGGTLPDEGTCVRTLQALTTLMSCGEEGVAYGALHGTTLAAALSIALVLGLRGTGAARGAAAAALPIMVSMVADRAAALAARAPRSDDAERAAADAAKLLADLVALTAGRAPLFLKVRALPPCFGLELLDLVLRGQRRAPGAGLPRAVALRAEPALRADLPRLLRALLRPAPAQPAFALALRAVRVALAYIRLLAGTYPDEANALSVHICLLLTSDVKTASAASGGAGTTAPASAPSTTPLWQRALALEALRSILGDPELLAALYRHNDAKATAVLEPTVAAIARLVQEAPRTVWTHLTIADATPAPRSRILEQLQVPLPPTAAAASGSTSDSSSGTSPTASPLSSSGRLSADNSGNGNGNNDGPEVRPTYVTALALSVLLTIVDALHQATSNIEIKDEDEQEQEKQEEGQEQGDEQQEEEIKKVSAVIWTPVLNGLNTALQETLEEGVMEAVLRAYKTGVGALGRCGEGAASEAWLASLARYTDLSVLMASLPPLTLSVLTTATPATSPAFAALFRHLDGAPPRGLAVVGALEHGERVRRLLARKGVLALAAVFGATHAACAVLRRGGWRVVLQTLEFVQAVLAAYGPAAVFPPDVCEPAALSDALARLFGCTVRMGRGALRALADELCACASASRDRAASKVQAYFVARLFEVLRLNLPRLDALWDPAARLLLSLFPASEVLEEQVVQGVGSLIDRAMNLSSSMEEGENEGENETTTTSGDASKTSPSTETDQMDVLPPSMASSPETILSLQMRFFSLLKGMLTATRSSETRQRVCEWTARVVQSAGHALDAAWPVVLGLLDAGVALGDRNVYPSVLQVVQLAAGDYLAEVAAKGARNVLLLTRVAARYAAQEPRVNASLAATETLWHVAAHVAKEQARKMSTKSCEEDDKEEDSESLVNEFWDVLTRSLCTISLDPRSDVRNSALSVLFRVATVHGAQLADGVWTAYFERVAELLDAAVQTAQDQPRDESPSSSPSPSARAEWCHTVALGYEGACRVLKAVPAHVLAGEACRAFWVRVCEASAAAAEALGAPRLAEALLPDYVLLLARAAGGGGTLYDAACTALGSVLDTVAARPQRASTSQCLAAFVGAATELGAQLTSAPLAALAARVDALSRLPLDEYAEADGMTTLQLAVHRFYAMLLRAPQESATAPLVVAHAARAVALAADLLTRTSTVRASARQTDTLVFCAAGDLRLCAELFPSRAVAPDALASCCDDTLAACVRGMAVRFRLSVEEGKQDDKDAKEAAALAVTLWDRSAETFASVADACLRWTAPADGAAPEAEEAVCDAVLRHAGACLSASGGAPSADVDARDAALMNVLVRAAEEVRAFSSESLGARLVALLAAHAVAVPGREGLTAACHGALLAAAQRDGARPDLAEDAYAALLQRADTALDNAVAAAEELAPCVSAELCVLLRGFARLETRAHARTHLLRLYPRLCRAVAVPDAAVRTDLAILLAAVGTHYLPSPPSPSSNGDDEDHHHNTTTTTTTTATQTN